MPLNTKIGGQARYIKDRGAICLMEDQAIHIYKKVETENIVNIDIIKQIIETGKLDKMDDNNGKINLYHEIITNKVEKDDIIISQIEQWSVLSNVVNYVQYDRHPKKFYDLDIKAVDSKSHKKIFNKEKKRQILELDFWQYSSKNKRRIFRHVQRHSVRSNKYY